MNPDKVIRRPEAGAYDPPLTPLTPLRPLWAALRADDEDRVCELVGAGEHDPNQHGPYDSRRGHGGPALGYALTWRLDRAAECLVVAGADVNAVCSTGLPVLGCARTPRSVRVMVAAGADINGADKDNGRSVLRELARQADGSTVEEAIRLGADVHHRDAWGLTPLFGARSVEVVRVLLEAGADPLAEDGVGMQPLWVAAMDGEADRVRLLLELGCEPDRLHPIRKITPAEYALERHHPEVAALIREWARGEPGRGREI